MKSLVVIALLMAFISAGCSSTTVIRSMPPGAQLYIDGSPVGQTPYTYTDTKIVGSTTSLRLKKDGYEEVNVTMSRSEEFDAGACAGGVFVLVPFLWIEKYKPEHFFEMPPKAGAASADKDSSDDSKSDNSEKKSKKKKKKKSEKSDDDDGES